LIFSARGQVTNYVRMSCGFPLDDSIDNALRTLGALCGTAVTPLVS